MKAAPELFEEILHDAVRHDATDVHLDPEEGAARVRIRVDGALAEVSSYEMPAHRELVALIKERGGMDVADTRSPQDGRLFHTVGNRRVDVRVASLPTIWGETVILRLIAPTEPVLRSLSALGVGGQARERLTTAAGVGHGLIIVSGSHGSGKTTTMYALLDQLNDPKRKIYTIESPIEWRLPGISQVQLDERGAFGMSAAMRAVFRADPDVLMIGEVRDREAATMAVEAAVTGRLVLTVMHADDAALGVTRLIDAVEPVLAASALICAAGQRLARMLCEACREPYEPAPEELLRLGLPPNGRTLYTARGCPDCAMTGYRGRVALIEAMVFTDDLRRLVLDRASADELRRAAVTAGMRTLRDEAIAGVLEGRLSFEEVDRVGLSKPIEEIVREVERARPTMGAAPDGTVTMMFTDIESSTAIAERLGDEHWMSLLRAHNLIVREHAAALGGFEVKTIGDAFMLAFDSARDALECAIRVQRSLATLETGRAGAEIRVRIGLHTGEAIREADDFYGRAVTLASRIAREAAGSQILASAIVKELVAGGGFVFGEPREAEIKGMEGRQTLYEVVWSVP